MKNFKTTFEKISILDFEKFNNIKVIIFDFDNTLYTSIDWGDWNDHVLTNFRKMFKDLTDEEFDSLLKKYSFNHRKIYESCATILAYERGSSKKLIDFLDFTVQNLNIDWSTSKVMSRKLIEELSKNHTLYIVSNSPINNIKYVASKVGLNLTPFKKILSNNFEIDELSKKKRYRDVLELEKVSPQEVLVVGDSFEFDILTAQEVGFNTLYLERPNKKN